MPKGPTFRNTNAARHADRMRPHLWYEECAEVDPRLLRIQVALEEEGFLTYETRIDLREMVAVIQRKKERRARLIESSDAAYFLSLQANGSANGVHETGEDRHG
jgi:hypothetical protein